MNDEHATLNERTLPNLEENSFPEPAMLEENFTEGVALMRKMVDVAPDEIAVDLGDYTDAIAALSEIYADYGYDREAVWNTAGVYDTWLEEQAVPDEVRDRIGRWVIANCGKETPRLTGRTYRHIRAGGRSTDPTSSDRGRMRYSVPLSCKGSRRVDLGLLHR